MKKIVLASVVGSCVLWAASVQPGAGSEYSVTELVAVPMVNGCPDLGGAGLDYGRMVVRNPSVRRNLKALRCGLTLEGYPPGIVDIAISGGESYTANGRVYSLSDGATIEGRKPSSAHNLEHGARAVDLWRSGNLADAQFYRIMGKYTAFRSPRGHGERHRHLSLGWQYNCPADKCSRPDHG